MKKDRSNVTREVKALNTKDLVIDPLYQRDLDKKKINKIVKNYDPCLLNFVKVSFRDGKYYMFDGRHTAVVEKTVRGKGSDVPVACLVFKGLTRLDEMELFCEQNGEATAVRTNDKYRAQYNFGDPDVTGMVGAAQCAGLRVDFTSGQAENKVTAVSTLMKLYLKMPRTDFIEMLTTIREAWNGTPESLCREILVGMERFFSTYSGRFNPKELAKNLKKVNPAQIVREAKSVGAAALTSASYARIILRVYNSGRSTKRLPDELM